MLAAGAWGLLAAGSLVVGAVIGLTLPIPRRIVALVLGFGAGALVSALAFDLTEEAFRGAGTVVTAAGLAAGALTYFLGNLALDRRGTGTTAGPGIVLGALLDGVPESIVLGATLLAGQGVSLSFLAAVLVSNLPEGLAGARDLQEDGRRASRIIGLWVGVAVASGVAAALGYAALGSMSPGPVAAVQAFAAGAIITMLADTMFPEAFDNGGAAVGLATAFGFATAFLLST